MQQSLSDLDREIFSASQRLQKVSKRFEYLCWFVVCICVGVVAGICFGWFRA